MTTTTDTDAKFSVGDIVEITGQGTLSGAWIGMRAKVLSVRDKYGDVYVEPFTNRPDLNDKHPFNWSGCNLKLVTDEAPKTLEELEAQPDPEPTMEQVRAENVQLHLQVGNNDARIASLIREKTALEVSLENANRRHQEDIATIGATLLEEAESRDWCGEFDTIVEQVNSQLHRELPERRKSYTVRVTPSVLTIEIDAAANEDDAIEQAKEIAKELQECGDRLNGGSFPDYASNWDYEVD